MSRAASVVVLGAVMALAVLVSACASTPPAPAATPDPFTGLAERSDQSFRDGLEAYGAGNYRDALTAFERAKILSPNSDPRIDQMVQRAKDALSPTPTPVPPTPASAATATPIAVAMSTAVPDVELGARYFGQVMLAVVPSKDGAAIAANQFFYQDQIGLRIDGLKQHLRLPMSLRMFNADSGRLIAEVRSEDTASNPTDNHLVRFWDQYVWYHEGGEEPGRYRVELYANGALTHSFNYTVGTVPVPTLQPLSSPPALTPTPTLPASPAPTMAPPAAVVEAPRPAPPVVAAPPLIEKPAPPTATPPPTPTVVPTPGKAVTSQIGGIPAGMDVDPNDGRLYVADASGVVWSTDSPAGNQRPTLGVPYKLPASSVPVDLAVDRNEARVYVATRAASGQACPAASTTPSPGCIVVLNTNVDAASPPKLLAGIPLPSRPGELRLDADRGLLYVVLPDEQAIGIVDVRSGRLVSHVNNLPQITSIALATDRQVLYAAHLGGQVTIIDTQSAAVVGRVNVTGAGLNGVATARGLAYAINTSTHELAVIEPMSQAVAHYQLSQEPAAVAASEDSGAVFVLSSRANVISRIDPTSGTEVGRVELDDRGGQTVVRPGDLQALRPRFVLNPANESVFATLPDVGGLAAVNVDKFPVLANAIPYVEAPDEPLPSESSPTLLAQPSTPDAAPSDPDEEAL